MTTFQTRLIELQNEQKQLLQSPDRRKKVVRLRIQEITKEFYEVKSEWRKHDEESQN